ncbi:MAG: hypothetical protein WCP28_16135, partial [Actinomycetes bacterium]
FGPVDPGLEYVEEVLTDNQPPTMRDARTSGKQGPFGSDTTMEQLLLRAGYDDARTVTDQIEFGFSSAQQRHEFSWSTGQRAMWLAMSDGQRRAARSEADNRPAQVAQADGSFRFTQQTRQTLAARRGG